MKWLVNECIRKHFLLNRALTINALDTATHRRKYLNPNIFLLPPLLSNFARAGWAGRGRGWWPVKLLPFQGKMRNPLCSTARRRRRKLILAKSSSTYPSAFAFSAWSGSFMPSTCGPAWQNGWWPCTRHLQSWMPIAAVPRFLRRGSGVHTGHRSILAWKPGVPGQLWQVSRHIQSQAEADEHICGGMVKGKLDFDTIYIFGNTVQMGHNLWF